MHSVRRTKIVCTLGPAVDSDAMIRGLLQAGMNVARLNFSHGNHVEHRERIARVRRISTEVGVPVALLLDTKGPEIRTGILENNASFELSTGDEIIMTTEDVAGTRERIGISYKHLPDEVLPGNHIFVADGLIDLEVKKVEGCEVTCVVRSGGTLGNRKNVNIPGVRVQLPAITEQDKADILFAIEEEMDFIAASFIRTPRNVEEIRQILREGESPIRIIAKIEDRQGLDNIDEIIRVSDGIMVARGDLGVQLAVEEIPLAQKRIIAKCNAGNKPVITATQMLDSMIENPRPTRAELTDVANAIFDGTDAVMLSGETAAGAYPIKACETLHKVALSVEQSEEYNLRSKEFFDYYDPDPDIGQAIAKATFFVASDVDAAAIIAPTLRGNTPRMLSKYRPIQIIIAVTTTEQVQRQLLLHWGIVPLVSGEVADSEAMVQNAIRNALDRGLIALSDRVVTTAGVPLHSAIPMNTIKVHILGNVLSRGQAGFGSKRTGRTVKVKNAAEAARRLRTDSGEVLLTQVLTGEFEDVLKRVAGVIVEEAPQISHERIRELNPEIACISQVPDALDSIENGITVTLDGDQKIVYEGTIL